MRRPDLAGPIFGQIGRDERVPASIRNRATQMAGSLGVDVLDAPAAPAASRPAVPANPGAPAAPAATREKAE
jgi:hypothetical protein